MTGELKYTEDVVRIPALDAEGKSREILERITHSREVQADGSLGAPLVVNRRFDLRTGESVQHLGGDDYELETGDRLRAIRSRAG